MDYKEKYERALAKAKEQYNYPCMRSCMGILEEIFPELKESEDEKVRKALIEYFNEQCDMSDWNGVYGYQVVSWLEKQGGQIDIANKEYWRGYREGKKEMLDKYAEIEKQGEQKPLTIDIKSMVDSYEQRLIKNGGVSNSPLVNMCVVAFQHGVENTLDELQLKQGQQILANSAKTCKDEQKPAWSEEDEVKINRIVACLENLNVADNDILLKDVDWLKSLRPQNHWKPSDEQMKILLQAVAYFGVSWSNKDNLALQSLYFDLKKLKEGKV